LSVPQRQDMTAGACRGPPGLRHEALTSRPPGIGWSGSQSARRQPASGALDRGGGRRRGSSLPRQRCGPLHDRIEPRARRRAADALIRGATPRHAKHPVSQIPGCARHISYVVNRAVSTRRMATLGVAGQSVVGDRLPRRGVRHKLTDARPDHGIVVERPHPDADRIGVTGIASKERRATVAAEPLLAARIRLPHAKPVLTRNDPKRAGCRMRVRRRRRSTAALAALAMAVARNYGDGGGSGRRTSKSREAARGSPVGAPLCGKPRTA
jgi:hypothetical protein